MLRCARCGGKMHGVTTRAGNRYYKCTGRNIGDPDFCRGAILPARIVEEAIWADIVEWGENPERPIAAILEQRAAGEHERAEALRQHEQLGAEIEEKQASRAEVIRWARQKRISEAEMEQQLEEIAAEVRGLQAKRHAITVRLAGDADYERRVDQVEALLAEVREAVKGATPERKRDLIGKLARRVEVAVEREGRRLAAVKITTTWVFQRDL